MAPLAKKVPDPCISLCVKLMLLGKISTLLQQTWNSVDLMFS